MTAPRNIALAVHPDVMPAVEQTLSYAGVRLGDVQGGQERLRVYRANCPLRPSFADLQAAEQLGVTVRQLRILELIAEGHGFPEIATKIGNALSYTREQAQDLYQLLDATDRASAVARGFRLGLLVTTS